MTLTKSLVFQSPSQPKVHVDRINPTFPSMCCSIKSRYQCNWDNGAWRFERLSDNCAAELWFPPNCWGSYCIMALNWHKQTLRRTPTFDVQLAHAALGSFPSRCSKSATFSHLVSCHGRWSRTRIEAAWGPFKNIKSENVKCLIISQYNTILVIEICLNSCSILFRIYLVIHNCN